MTDQQQLALLPPHRNHGLFADHYLDHVLPARPEWRALAMTITERTRKRYALHGRVRHRLQADLAFLRADSGGQGAGRGAERQADRLVDAGLPHPARRGEEGLQTRHPLAERDEWEARHAAQRAEHDRLTADIVRLETDLNARVYALFGLTAEEIGIIEESTKYRYGEV